MHRFIGRVAERPNAAVLKTAGFIAPWVQIPPLPLRVDHLAVGPGIAIREAWGYARLCGYI